MSLRQRREGRAFFRQRFAHHVAQGKSAKEAVSLATADGEKKYGADWAAIFAFVKDTLLPMLMLLFK
jgi:hypothetical protein